MAGASVRAEPASAPSAWPVIAAGICAALHLAKLPPAIAALQDAIGLTLLQAGFLLSLVQVAGMCAGVAFGAFADAIGLKRSMVLGLVLLGLASLAGGTARSVNALLLLRAVEGLGFLLVVLPAPGLLRRLVTGARLSMVLGMWGTYMPIGTALALLAGPPSIAALGWPVWWWALGVIALAAALWLARAVPGDGPAPTASATPSPAAAPPWLARVRTTLAAPGPWLVAGCFAAYSSQWIAVIGFLPTIYLRAGVAGATTGVLTAIAAAVNIVGNLAAGRLLQRGVPPSTLLMVGFIVMGAMACAAFAGAGDSGLPASLRYGAVLLFSMTGGAIPATLFSLSVRAAPSERTVSTTVGWVQQGSALGQFLGPPLVGWLAGRAGGWHWIWTLTASASLLGLWLARCIGRRLG